MKEVPLEWDFAGPACGGGCGLEQAGVFPNSRIQKSKNDCPGPYADMSPEAAAAMCAVLAVVPSGEFAVFNPGLSSRSSSHSK